MRKNSNPTSLISALIYLIAGYSVPLLLNNPFGLLLPATHCPSINVFTTPLNKLPLVYTSFNTIFLINNSGKTGKALKTIIPICIAYDANGINIYFLNNPNSTHYRNITTPATITEIFTSIRLIALESAKPKLINIIVITNGEVSNNVESLIIAAIKKLNKYDALACKEPSAKEHLKQLNDELIAGEEDLRDIINTISFTRDEGTKLTTNGILKVVLSAVN
ncbi:hypothetical protein V2W45_1472533 [Cenococcum geophilum]